MEYKKLEQHDKDSLHDTLFQMNLLTLEEKDREHKDYIRYN